MKKIQENVVKLSYFGFTRACGEVVVSECHVIPSPVNLIGYPVKCVGTANLVVKLSVTRQFSGSRATQDHALIYPTSRRPITSKICRITTGISAEQMRPILDRFGKILKMPNFVTPVTSQV